MSQEIRVETQGISEDWTSANGDYDGIDRGTLTPEALTEVTTKLLASEDPDYENGDFCPPNVMVSGPSAGVSFSMNEHKLYFQAEEQETEFYANIEVTPEEATRIVIGDSAMLEILAGRIAEAKAAEEARKAEAALLGPQPVTAPPQPTGGGFVRFIRWIVGVCVGVVVALAVVAGGILLNNQFDSTIVHIVGVAIMLVGLVLGWLVFRAIRGRPSI